MNERFTSVWHALPPGLRNMPLTERALAEENDFSRVAPMAAKAGYTLRRTEQGYRLDTTGIILHFIDLADIGPLLGRKRAGRPLTGVGGTCTPAKAENATEAVLTARSIASTNWTDDTQNATHAGCTDDGWLSNEF